MWNLVLVLCLAVTTAQLPAFGDRLGALDELAGKADAIVVGEIQSGRQTGVSVTLVLSVVRTIKGDLPEGTLLDISGDLQSSFTRLAIGKEGGLWFMKQSGNRWTFLPVRQGPGLLEMCCFVPFVKTALSGPVEVTHLPQTVGDKVALELVTALKQGNIDLKHSNAAWIVYAMFGERPFITGLLRDLRAQSNQDLKFLGLNNLLKTEDQVSALVELANEVDLVERFRQLPLVGTRICGIHNPDPAVVAILGRISPRPDMQACAASALALIHTRQTLPFLAQLLDSKDPVAREEAIRGLSRFVESLPIRQMNDQVTGKSYISQGPTPYRTADTTRFSLSLRRLMQTGESDAEYVQFWKSWWARMQDTLGRESAAQSLK